MRSWPSMDGLSKPITKSKGRKNAKTEKDIEGQKDGLFSIDNVLDGRIGNGYGLWNDGQLRGDPMRVFVLELSGGELRKKVDQKMVDDLAGQLMTDELFFLQRIADENKEVKPLDITQAILDEWKQMATDDGNADEYQYHIGMVYPPLPYKLWKLKKEALDRIQARDDYQAGLDLPQGVEHRADELVKELGY